MRHVTDTLFFLGLINLFAAIALESFSNLALVDNPTQARIYHAEDFHADD